MNKLFLVMVQVVLLCVIMFIAGYLIGYSNGGKVVEYKPIAYDATYVHNGTEAINTHPVIRRNRNLLQKTRS